MSNRTNIPSTIGCKHSQPNATTRGSGGFFRTPTQYLRRALQMMTLVALALISSCRGAVRDNAGTDYLTELFSRYFSWSGDLAAIYFHGLLRLWLTFALPATFTAVVFARGSRSVFTQTMACVIGVLLAATIPLDHVEIHNHFVRGWIIALAVVTLAFLPAILAFLLVPNVGAQRRVRLILYLILAGLLVGIIAQQGGYS